MVGNGVLLPVSLIGNSFCLFFNYKLELNNNLVSDQMVKNFISMRCFTVDNSVQLSLTFCFYYKGSSYMSHSPTM